MGNKTGLIQDKPLYAIAMSLYSFSIIALETLFFHVLLIVTNYLTATFIISIAMLGIAAGSILSFYLHKARESTVLSLFSIIFFLSIALSYYNITHIGTLKYPYFLVLPFLSGSVIISLIFSRANSNKTYFINLTASAMGVVFPIIFVPLLKSENCLVLLSIIPFLFLFFLSFRTKHFLPRLLFQIFIIGIVAALCFFIYHNQSTPDHIPAADFRTKILPAIRHTPSLKFMKKVFEYDEKTGDYILKGDAYDAKRASYILRETGYNNIYLDLNYDVKCDASMRSMFNKSYCAGESIVLSEDSLLGRIELMSRNTNYMHLAINSVLVDGIDNSIGSYFDPRVPHIDNARVFIVGLSADGIVKSAKRLKKASVSGIEINPIILRIMQEDGQFSRFSKKPYSNLSVYKGEGRSFLESHETSWDIITLMNIHAEHGPNCTLAPEYFHTVEALKLMLTRLTDRGFLVFEEILMNDRSYFAYQKFVNTVLQALQESGSEDPFEHIIAYSWDFWSSANNFRTIMIKRVPFQEKELKRFDKYWKVLTNTNRYPDAVLDLYPGKTIKTPLENFAKSKKRLSRSSYIPQSIRSNVFEQKLIRKLGTEDSDFLKQVYKYYDYSCRFYRTKINQEQKQRLQSILKKVNWPLKLDLSPVRDDKPFPFNIYQDKQEIKELMRIIFILTSLLFLPLLFLILKKFKSHGFRLPLHFM